MKVVVLGSGSKGNATYLETENTKILIDAGLSYTQIKLRLANQGIYLNNLDAILITHEHSDHIGNLNSLLAKSNAQLYINKDTYLVANHKYRNKIITDQVNFIEHDKKYTIKDLIILPILLSHDAINTYGYLLKEIIPGQNISFASITDTGYIPIKYLDILSTIKVLLIESNHDIEMLNNSGRPYELIRRISSERGHMSNILCAGILKKIASSHLVTVILGHLSQDCNNEEKAIDACMKEFDNQLPFQLFVAKQYQELPIIEIGGKKIS